MSQKNGIVKARIVADALERYTGSSMDQYQKYILLTNFSQYMNRYSRKTGLAQSHGSAMSAIHNPEAKISLIRFGIGSPNAALIMDLLGIVEPGAIIFLGMCGGLSEKYRVGDFFLPTAAIRDEGTSHHYLPEQVPAMPYFPVQRQLSLEVDGRGLPYRHGIIHTTNYRLWEFDEEFRELLIAERAKAIDMESATIFAVGYSLRLKVGALLLVSDLPMTSEGIKTKESSKRVFERYTDIHLDLGTGAMQRVQAEQESLKKS